MAGSRITKSVLPSEILALLHPNYVAPIVACLCHSDSNENGSVFEIGGGFLSRVLQQRAEGFSLSADSLKYVKSTLIAKIDQLGQFQNPTYPDSITQVNWIALAKASAENNTQVLDGDNADFSGKVAIVTGAGSGLGRAYAIFLAKNGAKVVVNDPGKASDGSWSADIVVSSIQRDGGIAIANYESVMNAEKIIDKTVEKFGNFHILINNAGILRDKSFINLSEKDWKDVLDVHLNGTYKMIKQAIPLFVSQSYGRILNTTSAVGLYGNFGQTNYSAAKAGIIALTKSVALEMKKFNVLINCIAPNAGTSMTATVFPKEVVDLLKPEYVAPYALALCHHSSNITGRCFEVGSGWISEVRWVHSAWIKIDDQDLKNTLRMTGTKNNLIIPQNAQQSFLEIQALASKEGDPIISKMFKADDRDFIIYNIGIGFDEKDIEYVYEGASSFKAFPTFAVIPGFDGMLSVSLDRYLQNYDPVRS